MRASASTECVYHGDRWRSSLQAVCNQMQGRYIPRKMLNRISRLVCPCNPQRFQDTQHELFSDTTCKGLDNWFEKNIFHEMSHGLTSVEHIFTKMLCDITPDHVSRIRFLVIVRCAIQEDLDILKRGDTIKSSDNRQKYTYTEEIELPIAIKYVSFFIGKAGCHIKPICKEYNCEIRFDIKRYSYRRSGNRQSVTTKININSAADLKEVQELLIARVTDVSKKRAAHDSKVEAYAKHGLVLRKIRQAGREERRDAELKHKFVTSTSMWVAAADMKDHNRETFSVKNKHQHEDRKKKTGVLEEGSRCLNCLSTLEKKSGGAVDGSCRYHPGYLTRGVEDGEQRVWSCCGDVLGVDCNKANQQRSHEESGCETGGQHNWRPTKNESSKKSKKKAVKSHEV